MRNQRIPRTIVVDHLHCSEPKKVGFFRRTLVCDYQSPEGIVREYHYKNKSKPEYRVLRTGEEVTVSFSFSMIEDMEGYFYNDGTYVGSD